MTPTIRTSKSISLPVFECDRCGACCKHLILEADHFDVLREPRIAERGTLCDGHGKLPLADAVWSLNAPAAKNRACVFLGTDNLCGIYPTRPSMCVIHQAGSSRCQSARKMDGLPPLAAVTRRASMLDRIAALAREEDEE